MEDRVESEGAENAREGRMAGQITFNELRFGRNGGAVPLLEIVEHDHVVTTGNQLGDAVAADETGATGNQNGFLMRHVKLLKDTARKLRETIRGALSRSCGEVGGSECGKFWSRLDPISAED